jgi:hypothetical protein
MAGRKQQGPEPRLYRTTLLLTKSEFDSLKKLVNDGDTSKVIRLALADRLAREKGAEFAKEIAEIFLPGVTENR